MTEIVKMASNQPEHTKDWQNLTIEECLDFSNDWRRGITRWPGAVGYVVLKLADEVRRLRSQLDTERSTFRG